MFPVSQLPDHVNLSNASIPTFTNVNSTPEGCIPGPGMRGWRNKAVLREHAPKFEKSMSGIVVFGKHVFGKKTWCRKFAKCAEQAIYFKIELVLKLEMKSQNVSLCKQRWLCVQKCMQVGQA